MNWPKYYKDNLLSFNEDAHIGIVTCWTKKEEIKEKLTPLNLNKVAVIGQLYSKEGISYIIRNLYLRPNVNTLIITGKDLSGSKEFFKNFLNKQENRELIHKEIPEEKIEEFIAWFSQNTYFIEEEQLNDTIDAINIEQDWTNQTIDFPEPEKRESNIYPSEEACFRLEDKKIADLWLKVLDRIIKFGKNKMSAYSEMQTELVNITTVISEEDPDDPYLPDFLYFSQQELTDYYPQLMTDHIFQGVEYTYGSRLRNHDGINQIEHIIKDLKENNYSRRAIAFTWNVAKDTGNPKSPCLNLVHALVNGEKLYLTCYMRSNDMYRAWPQNAFALRKVQKEISQAINIPMGKLIFVSNSAHIYERDYVEACDVVEKYKPKLECNQDPRGSFVIELKDEQIKVNHYSPDGIVLQTFAGKTATELQNQIFTFISDPLHALDLGQELYKAELALNNDLKYNQDNMLDLNPLLERKPGKLIVIDGTDGSGKSTQTKLLVERLKSQGYQVEMADFPQYGNKSASLVEEYLNGNFGTAEDVGAYRASIFYACDRYAAAPQIRKWLKKGKIVIANRYVSSSMGHQTGKIQDPQERERFLNWLENLEYEIFGIPKPDLNILLYVPPEIGQQLVDKKEEREYTEGKKRDIHEADLNHLNNAAQAFKEVAEKYNWLTINCAPENQLKSIEEISQILWQEIQDKL